MISFVLLYMAIVKKFEPLLLLPMAFGMFLTNLPLTGLMEYGEAGTFSEGLLGMIYKNCVSSDLFPCIMFLAVGAMTDFGPLLANPVSLLLGAAAQLGIYTAFILANSSGLFRPLEAAAIGVIGVQMVRRLFTLQQSYVPIWFLPLQWQHILTWR